MNKECVSCKYGDQSFITYPCYACNHGHIKWEPKNFGAACAEFFNEHSEPVTDEDKKEEKKMADTRKTKAQLMEELELKNAEIAELKKEMKRSEQYDLFVKAGKDLREAMDGLIEGGLTEEQAFAVILKNVK